MKLIHALPDVIQIRVVLMDVPDITLVADVLVVNLHLQPLLKKIITSGVVIVNVIIPVVWLKLGILALITIAIQAVPVVKYLYNASDLVIQQQTQKQD